MATPQVTSRILRRLLASGVTVRAERLLGRMAPADVALLLAELTREEIRTVVEPLFRQHRAARALKELPHEMLPNVFDALADQRLADVIGRLEIDDLLELVERIPEDRREEVVSRLPDDKRSELDKAELYPESSAGRVMTTNFVALDQKMSAHKKAGIPFKEINGRLVTTEEALTASLVGRARKKTQPNFAALDE